MHNSAFVVAHEYVVGVGYFGIVGQKMRSRIQMTQLSQYIRLAIAEAHVPRRFAGGDLRLRHAKEVAQRIKRRLEWQKLAVILEVLQ